MARNNLIKTIPTLYKQWSISFDILPLGTASKAVEFTNIIRLGIGGDTEVYGDRSPAIFFAPGTTALHVTSGINGTVNVGQDIPPIPVNEWTPIQVSQAKLADSYKYRIHINGTLVYETTNTDAREFENVTLYASDDFYEPANARIRNIVLDSEDLPTGNYFG